ncbi:MAG TPA: hypothetical protein VFV38_06170 [Ktedonobacteraceae bacterium]|nr:hypothetical protein [Ktedonobacteraceae bacterium]
MSITNGTQAQKLEEAYWRAWSHAQDGRWDQAGQVLFSLEVSGETIPNIRALRRIERRRKIYSMLVMGDVVDDTFFETTPAISSRLRRRCASPLEKRIRKCQKPVDRKMPSGEETTLDRQKHPVIK